MEGEDAGVGLEASVLANLAVPFGDLVGVDDEFGIDDLEGDWDSVVEDDDRCALGFDCEEVDAVDR